MIIGRHKCNRFCSCWVGGCRESKEMGNWEKLAERKVSWEEARNIRWSTRGKEVRVLISRGDTDFGGGTKRTM